MNGGVVRCHTFGYITASPRWHQPPEPAPGRDELVDDHLPDIAFRLVQAADLFPALVHPDQHFLHNVLGAGPITGQHRGEPQDSGEPPGGELLECHCPSATEVPDHYTRRTACSVVLSVYSGDQVTPDSWSLVESGRLTASDATPRARRPAAEGSLPAPPASWTSRALRRTAAAQQQRVPVSLADQRQPERVAARADRGLPPRPEADAGADPRRAARAAGRLDLYGSIRQCTDVDKRQADPPHGQPASARVEARVDPFRKFKCCPRKPRIRGK
jgi:hypothetical protein